jgi:DeoR/GlpR family transcriptional regulator of sugar metabolism
VALNFRQTEILELARAEGRVVVEDLAQRFDVTLQTIRRDLSTWRMRGIWTGCMAGRCCGPGWRTSATRRGAR